MSCRSEQLDISLRNTGIGWIDKQGHGACRRDQLVQHLQPLWRYFHVHIGHACDVATWPIKTGNESEPDRVGSRFKDDRNCRGRRLRHNCRLSRSRGNHRDLTMNKISQHRRQPINSFLRPVEFYSDVTTIDVPGFAQPFEKGRRLWLVILGRSDVDKPDHWQCRLLSLSRKRPRCRNPTNKADKFPSSHGSPLGRNVRMGEHIIEKGRCPCPLWVKSRHMQRKTACPLYPQGDIKCDTGECPLWAKSGHPKFRVVPIERLGSGVTHG